MELTAKENCLKWLITGGCGFIGTCLVKNLLTQGGHFIRVLDNLEVGTRDALNRACDFSEGTVGSGHVELMVGDIRDEKACLDAAEGMDIIIHLAANTGVIPSVKNPRIDMITNVAGTFNMLEAARQKKVSRFIFASSGAPAGECEPPIHEELAPHPVSPYGASKLAGEGYCSAYYKTFGIETIVLRFGNVYGPGSGHKNSVVAKFIRKAMDGEPLKIYGDGSQTRDFIFVDDLVRAIRLAESTSGVGGEIFQIATGKETTLIEMLDILIPYLEQMGVSNIQIEYCAKKAGDVMRNFSDTSKAMKMLNWFAEYNLNSGLGKTIRHFMDMSK
jgi:UDP-glucose 4-epimerase